MPIILAVLATCLAAGGADWLNAGCRRMAIGVLGPEANLAFAPGAINLTTGFEGGIITVVFVTFVVGMGGIDVVCAEGCDDGCEEGGRRGGGGGGGCLSCRCASVLFWLPSLPL